MLAIGIDPGTATTGYGLVRITDRQELQLVEYGVVRTDSGETMPSRLLELHQQLSELVSRHQPQTAAVEKLFFQRNVTTALSVGQARGIALLVMAQAGITVGAYSPSEIKQAVVGYGKADKNQVQHMVQRLLGMRELPSPDDAADALAVAICHLQTEQTHARYRESAQ